jgi:hypothetical protein
MQILFPMSDEIVTEGTMLFVTLNESALLAADAGVAQVTLLVMTQEMMSADRRLLSE